MSTDSDLRREIVRICRRMYERGLIAGAEGNVSARLENGAILVTPKGPRRGSSNLAIWWSSTPKRDTLPDPVARRPR